MTLAVGAPRASLMLTSLSLFAGMINILLGRWHEYLRHLPLFNTMAALMLALVVAALVTALVPLIRARGRSASAWLAASFASAVLIFYLFEG